MLAAVLAPYGNLPLAVTTSAHAGADPGQQWASGPHTFHEASVWDPSPEDSHPSHCLPSWHSVCEPAGSGLESVSIFSFLTFILSWKCMWHRLHLITIREDRAEWPRAYWRCRTAAADVRLQNCLHLPGWKPLFLPCLSSLSLPCSFCGWCYKCGHINTNCSSRSSFSSLGNLEFASSNANSAFILWGIDITFSHSACTMLPPCCPTQEKAEDTMQHPISLQHCPFPFGSSFPHCLSFQEPHWGDWGGISLYSALTM